MASLLVQRERKIATPQCALTMPPPPRRVIREEVTPGDVYELAGDDAADIKPVGG